MAAESHLDQLPGEVRSIAFDGLTYRAQVLRQVVKPPEAPRLVVISRLVNEASEDILDLCIRAVRCFTPEPHELWIVDNNSPRRHLDRLIEVPDVNLILSRTEPRPPDARTPENTDPEVPRQQQWGSYANAAGLELAVRTIDPQSRHLMTMHMDTLPCRNGWLSFLRDKIDGRVAAAGVRMDRTRTPEGVLHVLGFLVDFQVFRSLNLDFFPDLPALDVGDNVTVRLREAGYDVFACPNTVWQPELVKRIPVDSPLRDLPVDRSFDDDGNVIVLHLGRGIRRTTGEHVKGITVEDWVDTVCGCILPQVGPDGER